LWEHFETRKVKGTPDALRPHFEGFLNLLEGRGRIAESLLGLARERVLLEPSLSREISIMEESAAALRNLREKVERLWVWLQAPAPVPNRERVEASRAAFIRGECEDVAEVLRRVQTGGFLATEYLNRMASGAGTA
jgi:hypothetical protein